MVGVHRFDMDVLHIFSLLLSVGFLQSLLKYTIQLFHFGSQFGVNTSIFINFMVVLIFLHLFKVLFPLIDCVQVVKNFLVLLLLM